MKSTEQKCRVCKIVFFICLLFTIGLMVAGFCVPPTGVIDGSVLKGCSLLFLFAALDTGIHAITLGYDLKVQKGDTSVELNNE